MLHVAHRTRNSTLQLIRQGYDYLMLIYHTQLLKLTLKKTFIKALWCVVCCLRCVNRLTVDSRLLNLGYLKGIHLNSFLCVLITVVKLSLNLISGLCGPMLWLRLLNPRICRRLSSVFWTLLGLQLAISSLKAVTYSQILI